MIKGRMQYLNLADAGCTHNAGVYIHEILHTLAVPHEHQRPDRDTYVTIDMSKVKGKVPRAQGTIIFFQFQVHINIFTYLEAKNNEVWSQIMANSLL